ncbi:MAG: hypothetical protein JWR07_40 [Nevskia sp.]|nr:hypothetical protein [Nevskia sp.]
MATQSKSASDQSLAYWRDSARPAGADLVLRQSMLELLRHVGADQVRALCYATGVRLATDHPLGKVDKLSELEIAAQSFLAARDWGWMAVEEHQDAVDLVHGCSPLRAWFGEAGLIWSAALFEGFYAEWLRQIGAGEGLELRQVESPSGADDVLRFRLMHESRFKAGAAP